MSHDQTWLGPSAMSSGFCRWGGAAVGDAPSPRRSRGGCDTWSGSSNDRGLGPATRRRLPPGVGRRTEVRATDRGRPDARKGPAPWPDEGADGTGAEGRRAVAIRRWKLARDRPSAAQAAPISPRPGGRAATASIRTPRRRASTGPAAKPLFLDFDNRLGALQAQRHALVVALQLRMFGRQRVGLGDLGAALDRLQRLAGAGVALPTPIRQQRGIEPLAPQDRANAARPRLIDLAEYPKLVGARERPTAWPVGEFRRGRRWRSNKARPTASLCCGAIGKSLFEGDERHDHGRM